MYIYICVYIYIYIYIDNKSHLYVCTCMYVYMYVRVYTMMMTIIIMIMMMMMMIDDVAADDDNDGDEAGTKSNVFHLFSIRSFLRSQLIVRLLSSTALQPGKPWPANHQRPASPNQPLAVRLPPPHHLRLLLLRRG